MTSGRVLGFFDKDVGWVDSWQIRDKKDVHPSHATKVAELGKAVPVRLASESVELAEHEKVLEENRVLKEALKAFCREVKMDYNSVWKRIKPDKWREYLANIIKP